MYWAIFQTSDTNATQSLNKQKMEFISSQNEVAERLRSRAWGWLDPGPQTVAGRSLSPLLHVWFLLSPSMCKPHFLLHVVVCLACHYHNWRVKRSLCLHFLLGKFMVGLWSCLSYILSPDLVSICSMGGDRYVKGVPVIGDPIKALGIGRGAVLSSYWDEGWRDTWG